MNALARYILTMAQLAVGVVLLLTAVDFFRNEYLASKIGAITFILSIETGSLIDPRLVFAVVVVVLLIIGVLVSLAKMRWTKPVDFGWIGKR